MGLHFTFYCAKQSLEGIDRKANTCFLSHISGERFKIGGHSYLPPKNGLYLLDYRNR